MFDDGSSPVRLGSHRLFWAVALTECGAMANRSLRFACLLGASVMAASCSAVNEPFLVADSLPIAESSTTTLETAESSTDIAGQSDPSEDLVVDGPRAPTGRVLALITPSGVIVPVTSDWPDGYTVITPCGNTAELSWGTPIRSAQVVLDPGHGGEVETGAVGLNGLAEKDLNLDVAKRAARELQQRGIDVVLTRTGDYRIPLANRTAIAEAVGARILVSIHHNAPDWAPSDTPGTEVFVQHESDESRRLGGLIWEEVVDALSQFEDVEWTAADDAGALAVLNKEGGDTYGMVRRPTMPAVLAELGYISNPSEAALFATQEYVDVAGVAVADAVQRWLYTADEGSGFVDTARNFTPSGGTGGVAGCVDPALE